MTFIQRFRIKSAIACLIFLSYSYGEPLISLATAAPRISKAQLLSNPALLQQFIDDAYNAGDKSVTIPAGTYRLDGGTQNEALYIDQYKNFTINATGVTVICTNVEKSVIYFHHCVNVTLNGGIFSHDPPGFSQGTVTAIAPDHIDVAITPGYPTDLDQPDYVNVVAKVIDFFDPSTRDWVPGANDGVFSSTQRLGPSSFRFLLKQPLTPGTPVVVGDLAAWRGVSIPGIELYLCQNMQLLGVTAENIGSLAFEEYQGLGNNYYNGCKVIRGPAPTGANPKDTPLFSAAADGFHSGDMDKGPTYDNCYVEFNDDDAFSIWGALDFVTESHGNTITIGQQSAGSLPVLGDIVRLYDTNGAWVDDAKVVGTTLLSNYVLPQPVPPIFVESSAASASWLFQQLQLDHPIPAQFSWVVSDANAVASGLVIRNCRVHHNRYRGMLIKASNALIENNTIDGSTVGGIVIMPEVLTWGQSDYTRNTTIRQNTIENTPLWNSTYGALNISEWRNTTPVPLPGGHQDIIVEGNVFKNNDGVNIVLGSAQRVTFCKNEFIQPMVHNKNTVFGIGSPGSLYWVTQSKDVTIENNQIVQPGAFMKMPVLISATAVNVVVQN